MLDYKKNLDLLTKNYVYSKEMEHDKCEKDKNTYNKKNKTIKNVKYKNKE